MDKVLLDTSVLIDIERANKLHGQVWAIATLRNLLSYRHSEGNPCLSTVSVTEILAGLHRDVEATSATRFKNHVVNDYRVLNFDINASFIAAEILSKLESVGRSIGISDCLIASVALRNNLTLVSSNTKHFERIVEAGFPLKVTNWRDG